MSKTLQGSHHHSRWFWKVSLLILALCLAWWGWLKLRDPQLFPIRHVVVQGSYFHVNQQALRQAILPFLQGGFLWVNTRALRADLTQLAWVYSVQVQRVWPDKLIITLMEQQPIARFNNNALLNAQGDIFTVDPNAMPDSLPWFIGTNGEQKLLLDAYHRMSAVLIPLHVKITALALDPRQAWRLQLDNGIVVLVGRDDPYQRLQRLAALYPQMLASKASTVDTVDLRYAHGIAVRYKQI